MNKTNLDGFCFTCKWYKSLTVRNEQYETSSLIDKPEEQEVSILLAGGGWAKP
jgi:uncharacterized protein YodC (DUF2158 family)